MNYPKLKLDVESLLPKGKGFILVIYDLIIPTQPVLVTNTVEDDAIFAMRQIVEAKDAEDQAALN